MPDQIGLAFLVALSVFFGGYGLAKLVQAYRTVSLDEWRDKALPGAGGVVIGVLFAVMAFRTLG